MVFGIPLFSYVLFFSAAVTLALGIYALTRTDSFIRMIFFMLMISITVWSFFQALEMAAAAPYDKILWAQAEYVGIATIPLLWFLLAFNYGARPAPGTRRLLYLLWVLPIITIAMAFTNAEHRLLWKDFIPIPEKMPAVSAGHNLDYVHGPWFWVTISYSYLLLLAGSVLLIRTAYRSKHLLRHHALVIIIGALFPWAANFIYIAGLSPVRGLDATTVAFTASGTFFAWGIFRLKFLNVIPIAHALIVEQMKDGIIVLDEHRCLVEINPPAREIAGPAVAVRAGEKPDLTHLGITDAITGCDDPAVHSREMTLPAPDGRIIEIISTPITSGRKRGRGRLITLRDITERRKNEEALRQLFRAVEQSPTSVIITDRAGAIEYVNPKFSDVTGYRSPEVLGQNPRILKSGAQPPEVYRDLWETITAGGTWRGELHNRKKSGELYWEIVSISPIVNDRGDITHFVAVKEDITARKLAEEALRNRNEIIEKDLASAQMMQRSLLPREIPNHPGLAVAYRYLPLESIGGDYLSFTSFPEGGFGVFIGDVSGHGVSAALFISMLKVVSDRVCRIWGDSPEDYMKNLNRELVNSGFAAFITALYGRFDFPEAGRASFRFSRGGHPHPVVFERATGLISFAESRGTLVGWFPGLTYPEKEVSFAAGDRFFLYTDGFPETVNPDGEMLGYDSLLDIIRDSMDPSLETTLDRIIAAIRRHRGTAPPEDDTIIIGIEVRQPPRGDVTPGATEGRL